MLITPFAVRITRGASVLGQEALPLVKLHAMQRWPACSPCYLKAVLQWEIKESALISNAQGNGMGRAGRAHKVLSVSELFLMNYNCMWIFWLWASIGYFSGSKMHERFSSGLAKCEWH